MQIALCDDEQQQLNILEDFLRAYEKEHDLDFSITRFVSGETLMNSSEYFQIIFMDIYLDRLLGTDVIRQLNQDTQVVFTTTSREHAIEAFGLGAVHYLLKPLKQSDVWEAMDRCLSRLGENAEHILQILSNHGKISIPTASINYIEVFNKVCIVHTDNQQFQTYTSLNMLFEQLDSHNFLRPQRLSLIHI